MWNPHKHLLEPCLPSGRPGNTRNSLIWILIRNANLQIHWPHPKPTDSETPREGPSQLCFTKASKWLVALIWDGVGRNRVWKAMTSWNSLPDAFEFQYKLIVCSSSLEILKGLNFMGGFYIVSQNPISLALDKGIYLTQQVWHLDENKRGKMNAHSKWFKKKNKKRTVCRYKARRWVRERCVGQRAHQTNSQKIPRLTISHKPNALSLDFFI